MAPTIIKTPEQLAEHVRAVDNAQGADRHTAMISFHLELDMSRLDGVDPHGDDYREKVLELFNFMHCAEYTTDLESQVLDYDVRNPTPFPSRSPHVIGSHFGAIATILRDFPTAPPARVLDVGVGWGHTSLMLARSGFDVDALDINEGYLKLVDHWAERMHVADRLTTLAVPFDAFGTLTESYDAILFFESFHHAINHAQLIRDCVKLLKPGGSIVFAGEPIYRGWPVPWCVRSDSLSAYCIHKLGWMELGFDEDYFLEMLMRAGLYAVRRNYIDFPIASGYVAQRAAGLVLMESLALPSENDATWHVADSGLRWSRGASTLPGSLVGSAQLEIHLFNHFHEPIDVTLLGGDDTLAQITVPARSPGTLNAAPTRRYGSFTVQSATWSPAQFGSTDARELGVAVHALVV